MRTTSKRPGKKMISPDYRVTFTSEASSHEVFKKINSVTSWWTEDFEGKLENPEDEFIVRFGATWIKHKIVELVPGKKIVWRVTDCYKHWLKNKKEWNGTSLEWEISDSKEHTRITFTHV